MEANQSRRDAAQPAGQPGTNGHNGLNDRNGSGKDQAARLLHSAEEQAEAEKRESDRRFEVAFYAAPIGKALVGLDGRFASVNAALCEFLGRTPDELEGMTYGAVTHPADLSASERNVERLLAGEASRYEAEKRYLRPDGSAVWGRLHLVLVSDDAGAPSYFVAQVVDIDERKQAESGLHRYSEQLRKLALQDPTTGLRNYRAFHNTLDESLRRASTDGSELSIVLIQAQLPQRSNGNGGGSGKGLLRRVAEAIAVECRDSDVAARIDEGRFALLLPGTAEDAGRMVAERVRAAVDGLDAGATAWTGLAAYPDAGRTKELLLLRAELDLYIASPAPAAASEWLSPATAERIEGVLRMAREQLGMDLAFLGRLEPDGEVFQAVHGNAESFGLAAGDELPLSETYCHRMVNEEIPNVVTDVESEEQLRDLAVTESGDIGAYVGVPLLLPDGRAYGALCTLSHKSRPDLGKREASMMRFLSGLVGEILEQDDAARREHDAEIELSHVHALVSALSARDQYTGEHSRMVVNLATAVADHLGVSPDEMLEVEETAILHDIGKVGIPDSILQKRGKLSKSEWELMRQHPIVGERIVGEIESLAHLAPTVRAEHERFDGGGYPDGLRADEIPIASRITFACDAYHAMVSDRPYRSALSSSEARDELRRNAGTQFDPRVVKALLEVLDGDNEGRPSGPTAPSGRASRMTTRRFGFPSWVPSGPPGSGAVLAAVRCACKACGAHVTADVSMSAIGGRCSNCDSYELEVVG